ncbi:MAG: tRNA-dihydrouridine synthase [Pseudomonadota bacterium]|jgi:tRNA-dihydrouridine synthase C
MNLSRVLLAPMEGLLDAPLRDVLTRAGGVDRCVSEFVRVTGTLLPDRVFRRIAPELDHGGRTPAGVPVRVQLLGSDPVCLAENAARLAALGPHGIDLNFGCPAKTVNRHRGGAVLLDEPELMHAIVSAVRRAVPPGMAVSAKMRLGVADDRRAEEGALALAEGGAEEIVVHARTRDQGYRPPAHWARIGDLRAVLPPRVALVANGEIWTVEDARRCVALSGCDALMLGRGIVADPGLARELRGDAGLPWAQVLPLMRLHADRVADRVEPRHRAGRIKQWLHLLRRRHPEADEAYARLRTVNDANMLAADLFGVEGAAIGGTARGSGAAPAAASCRTDGSSAGSGATATV